MTILATLSQHACLGGTLGYYKHPSQANDGDMRFAVYTPPQAEAGRVPVLYYLAGLTCTEETFVTKAGALEHAARHGLMLVAPDTSPRVALPGDRRFVGFRHRRGVLSRCHAVAVVVATTACTATSSTNCRPVIAANFKADVTRSGIMGHSMGGHGALTIALEESAEVPVGVGLCADRGADSEPWGQKAFTGYLGADRAGWAQYDATELVKAGHRFPGGILVDQGTADKFLADQLKPGVAGRGLQGCAGRSSSCTCATATTTATSSSRHSSRSISIGMRSG